MKRLKRKLKAWLARWALVLSAPPKSDLVKNIVCGTAALELLKEQSRTLPPFDGMYSHIVLTGNSLPVFTYQVFSKGLMEFILVRVEVSLPDRIHYRAFICEEFPKAKKEIECLDSYCKPFELLLINLYNYWPLRKKDE